MGMIDDSNDEDLLISVKSVNHFVRCIKLN
jgi:hypothetical protein